MIDYSRIVDDLRTAVCSASPEWADFLRSAAADYAVACEEVNERLRKCGEYLRKGLRSEAIQLAEIEPTLLDCVAILDFSERDYCCDVLAQYGIRTPPPLMVELAGDLNEAYAVERPMASLMQQHRLLALAHAPLRDRVAVLQQIAEADENNPVWQEDLIEFERERLKELNRELTTACNARDFHAVNSIHNELTTQRWQELPPENLIKLAGDYRKQLFGQIAREELERIAHDLNESFSGFDLPRAKQLRERWNKVTLGNPLPDSDPLQELALPALNWIAEEESRAQEDADFAAAVAALEYALDREAPPADLERAYRKVASFGREVSEFLETRYHKRREAQELQMLRKHRVQLIVVVLVGLILAGAVGAGIYFPLRARRIAAHVDQLQSLLDGGQYEEAAGMLANLDREQPAIASQPKIVQQALRLKKLQQTEAERRESFENLAARINANLLRRESDVNALGELGKLATTSTEKTRVLQLRADLAKLERELSEARNATFLVGLKKLLEKIDAIDVEKRDDLDAMRAELRLLQNEVSTLEDGASGVSREVLAQTKPLLARLGVLDRAIRRREEELMALERISSAVGDRIRFVSALTTYAQDYAESSRAADFRQVMEEETIWKQVEAWNQLVRGWPRETVLQLNRSEAAKCLESLNQFRDSSPGFEPASQLETWALYLAPIMSREQEAEKLHSLTQLFADPLVANLWQVNHVNGKRYFGQNKPKLAADAINGFEFVVDFEFNVRKIGLKEADVASHHAAPQNAVAAAATQLLAQLQDSNWDETFYRILSTIEASQQLDPVLKLRLFERTLEVARPGSLVFDRAFADFARAVTSSNVDTRANWLDPEDAAGGTEREHAAEHLKKLPTLKALARNVVAERKKLPARLGPAYRWIGWLQRDAAGKWKNSTATVAAVEGDLVLFAPNGSGRTAVVPIGRLNRASLQLQPADSQSLLEGRPIFLEERSQGEKTARTNHGDSTR